MKKPRQFITTEDIASALGYHIETVRRNVRAGLYDAAKIGDGSKPYRFNRPKIERQLGLEPGTLA